MVKVIMMSHDMLLAHSSGTKDKKNGESDNDES
jgi:hypothetical protein